MVKNADEISLVRTQAISAIKRSMLWFTFDSFSLLSLRTGTALRELDRDTSIDKTAREFLEHAVCCASSINIR